MAMRWLIMAAALVLTGAALAQTAPVEIRDAWARATPGKAETGAAYLTLLAPSGDRLTGAETPAAAKAELHAMTMEGTVMKMRPLAGLDLPPGQPVVLKPGGVHLMLQGLKERLRQGQSFPLTLHFAKAGTREVTVAIEKAGAMGMPGAGSPGMAMPMQHSGEQR